MTLRFTAIALAAVLFTMVAAPAQAQVDARMFRYPACRRRRSRLSTPATSGSSPGTAARPPG